MKFFRRIWLPLTLPELAVWFVNFAAKLAELADDLGITPAQLASINEDREMVQWLANVQVAHETNGAGVRGFRDETLFGEKGEADPVAPDYALPSAPTVFKTRIIERLLELVGDIEDAENYSRETIGKQLGIVPPDKEQLAPEDWTTTLKGKVLPASELEIAFTRGASKGVNLQFQYDGEQTWQNAGNFPTSPALVTIVPKIPNTPQTVRIRGRLLSGNKPVGQYSPEIILTAVP